jgi:hypothetical protein
MVALGLVVETASMASAEEKAGQFQMQGQLLPTVTKEDKDRSVKPLRDRDPQKFWGRHRRVCQTKGIVIKDKDYVVKYKEGKWWKLDTHVVGTVVEVRRNDLGVVVQVLFKNRNLWGEQTFTETPESVTTQTSEITLTRAGVREDRVTYTRRQIGVAVPKESCGLIVREEGDAAYVDFPEGLLSYEIPGANDRVIRGPDWFDGYADGGETPFGDLGEGRDQYYGDVMGNRDTDGIIEVLWMKTGRKTVHRSNSPSRHVDVEKLPPANDQD